MNSPPTPPYCGSVAAALHLMNSQIRCGSCREKVSVYRLAMDATRQGDDVVGWESGACSGISSRHSIKGSSEPFASSARVFSGFCLSFIRSISEHFARSVFRNKNFSPLMPINGLINGLINSEQLLNNSCSTLVQSLFKKSIHGQFVNNSWTLMFQKGCAEKYPTLSG